MTFDGEDFFPEEFLQRLHEFTREEDHILASKGKTDKSKDSKATRNNPNLLLLNTNAYN